MNARFLTVLSALPIAACSSAAPTNPGCYDICPVFADVSVAVIDPQGVPVAGARVEMLTYLHSPPDPRVGTDCVTQRPESAGDQGVTDSAGLFGTTLTDVSIAPAPCLIATAFPPEGSTLQPGVDTITSLDWGYDGASPPLHELSVSLID